MNPENLHFYSQTEVIDWLEGVRTRHFGDNVQDMRIFAPYYMHAKNLLEIGSGYGRCIDYLLANQFGGNITGVDYSPMMCAKLQERYQNVPNVRIINQSILDFDSAERFDAVLATFSVFMEFSDAEHETLLRNLHRLMCDGASLLIDVSRGASGNSNFEFDDNSTAVAEAEFGTITVRYVSQPYMQQLAEKTGFQITAYVEYLQKPKLNRIAYVFEKLHEKPPTP